MTADQNPLTARHRIPARRHGKRAAEQNRASDIWQSVRQGTHCLHSEASGAFEGGKEGENLQRERQGEGEEEPKRQGGKEAL